MAGVCPSPFLSLMAKNNERLIGTKMKKLVIMLLVFSLLCLNSCGLLQKFGIGGPDGATEICEIANNSKPTKVTTEVNYITNNNESLQGYYVTTTDGSNAIFEYSYDRFATPAESIELGNSDRIITSEGVINFKDGVYFGDEEDWKPGSGTAFDLKLKFDTSFFKDIVVSEDMCTLEAKISAEKLVAFIGTDLNASGDATVTITTNGVNLTGVTISCTTANGSITIRNSYTYNPQVLFPEVEEDGGETAPVDPENT